MKRLSIIFFFLTVCVNAAYLDDDMDGVENRNDLCPNSSIMDIVDKNGCVIEKLTPKKESHFDISAGLKYARIDDYSQSAQSLSFGYYYGDFSAYFYTSNYNIDNGESGIDDSSLSVYYRLKKDVFSYGFGGGVYIPTYDSPGNKTDYFLNVKAIYYTGLYDLSLSLGHTFMRDADTVDTNRISLGVGYQILSKAYLSFSYTDQDSVYEGEPNLKNIAFYSSYFFGNGIFLSGDLSFGVSESATDVACSLSLGYYF